MHFQSSSLSFILTQAFDLFSGYMAPEYAINGVVSIKIDVFSFGVLLLEILSGKKNNSRSDSDRPLNLIGYVSFSFSTQMTSSSNL